MTVSETFHYIAVGNPVSKTIISKTSSLFSRKSGSNALQSSGDVAKGIVSPVLPSLNELPLPSLYKLAGRHYNFVRLAGLSGASAVILGAIGSHVLLNANEKNDAKTIFETANRFHFFHSLALLAAPIARYPVVTGVLMFSGTLLFCGSLYYRAFTGEKTLARYAPIGGSCLIMAWLTFLF